MIGNAVKEMLLENEDKFLIPDENVAHVMANNPLSHALLVLTKVGYSKIPVLNKEGQIEGLISLSAVVNAMFDLTDIDPKNLAGLTVGDVMETDVQTLQVPFEIERVLHLLVDLPFIPVVDSDNKFQGIVTRREIMKSVNHLAHELELRYDVESKETISLKERQIS